MIFYEPCHHTHTVMYVFDTECAVLIQIDLHFLFRVINLQISA